MRNLILKNFIFDWKYVTNIPTIISVFIFPMLLPSLIYDRNLGLLVLSMFTTSLVFGIIMKNKNYGNILISLIRHFFIIYGVMIITLLFMSIFKDSLIIGSIGSIISVLLYFTPLIFSEIRTILWCDLDTSQKWQLGCCYIEGMKKIDNPYMNKEDWNEWKLLNTYYAHKHNHINHII